MGAATLAEVAVRFGRDIATISRRAARLRLDARQDPALGGQLEVLQRRLKLTMQLRKPDPGVAS
jgi:hypothetical protein